MALSLETVAARLQTFGYTVKSTDEAAVEFAIGKVTNTILNETNQPGIPAGLVHVAIDMVCGEFLQSKVIFAPDDLSGFDLGAAVKQIRTGDTETEFATGSDTPEGRLSDFVNWLLTYGCDEFNAYRRLRW